MKVKSIVCALLCASFLGIGTYAQEELRMSYEVFVEPQYEDAREYSGGFAAVKQNGKWGYITGKGNVLIQPMYDYACDFNEGLAVVGDLCDGVNEYDGSTCKRVKIGLVNSLGEYIPLIASNYLTGNLEHVQLSLSDCFKTEYVYTQENKSSYSVTNYNEPINIGFNEGYLVLGGKYIFDRNGKELVLDIYREEESISPVYSDGFFMIPPWTMGEDYKFYDKNGDLVLDITKTDVYKKIEEVDSTWCYCIFSFFDGYAGFTTDSPELSLGVINKKGEIVLSIKNVDYFSYRSKYMDCFDYKNIYVNDEVIYQNETGKWGAVDISGKTVIPFKYDILYPATEGLYRAGLNGKYGFVDDSGNWAIDPQYDDVTGFGDGIALVIKDGNVFAIDRHNNKIYGAENVPLSEYIKQQDDGGIRVSDASDVILIKNDNKYGFARLTYKIGKPNPEEMSEWAYEEVTTAIDNNLVPKSLQYAYYNNITREEFASLIVNSLEEIFGKDIGDILYEKTGITKNQAYTMNPFNDTSDIDITICNLLGIINGVSDTEFDPDNQITRQQAAALLMRTAVVVGCHTDSEASVFSDDSAIAEYAKSAVDFVSAKKIMNGVGNNLFAPNSLYTREQAYITVQRLFELLK